MADQLMLGILLIIVGIAVALIAVALVFNRREDRIAAELNEGTDDEESSDTEGETEVELEAEEEEETDTEEDEQESDDEAPKDEQPEKQAEAILRERQLVAEVYREEVTGKLIILSGDHEYSNSKQIEDEAERRRLAYAASDLADWFQGEFEPRGLNTQPAAAPPGSPDQMLDEINRILQRLVLMFSNGSTSKAVTHPVRAKCTEKVAMSETNIPVQSSVSRITD
jgi:hypothetical protein